jgi:hypothetical protein
MGFRFASSPSGSLPMAMCLADALLCWRFEVVGTSGLILRQVLLVPFVVYLLQLFSLMLYFAQAAIAGFTCHWAIHYILISHLVPAQNR